MSAHRSIVISALCFGIAASLSAAEPKHSRELSNEPLRWRAEKTRIKPQLELDLIGGLLHQAVDIDQDGDPDILVHEVSSYDEGTVPFLARLTAWENDGTGRFRRMKEREWLAGKLGGIDRGSDEQALIEDFNGDGVPDIYLFQTGAEPPGQPVPGAPNPLFLSRSDGRYRSSPRESYPGQHVSFTHHAAAADVDGDGDLDIWDANWGGEVGPRLLINDGDGGFRPENDRLPGGTDGDCAFRGVDCQFPKLVFCDTDEDGDVDIVGSPGNNYNRAPVLENLGAGYFGYPIFVLPRTPKGQKGRRGYGSAPVCADLDLDGDKDLLIPSHREFSTGEPHLALLQNRGKGRFKDVTKTRLPQSLEDEGGTAGTISIVDLNNDGWPDIVLPLFSMSGRVFVNRGKGRFRETLLEWKHASVDVAQQLTPLDADGDGLIDLLATDHLGDFWIFFNETKVKRTRRERGSTR